MVVTPVMTVLLGGGAVTVDTVVAVGVVCGTLVLGAAGAGSVSSQTVFLLPRRRRSLPLCNKGTYNVSFLSYYIYIHTHIKFC